jgi:hypothetical protein
LGKRVFLLVRGYDRLERRPLVPPERTITSLYVYEHKPVFPESRGATVNFLAKGSVERHKLYIPADKCSCLSTLLFVRKVPVAPSYTRTLPSSSDTWSPDCIEFCSKPSQGIQSRLAL